MSVQDYMSALKLGKREYNACVNKGKYPYLPVMESMMDEEQIDSEVSLGIDQIPLRLVYGKCRRCQRVIVPVWNFDRQRDHTNF